MFLIAIFLLIYLLSKRDKGKINKWFYNKLKKFLYYKRNHQQNKKEPLNGRTYLPMIHLIKG